MTKKPPILKIVFPRYESSMMLPEALIKDQGLTDADIKAILFEGALKSYKESVDKLTVDDCRFAMDYRDVTKEEIA